MLRIAVIDDEPKIRRGIAGMLRNCLKGRAVIESFSSAGDLVRAARKEELHLLITDIRMPDLDGLELGNYLKLFYPKLKIILISGYRDFEYAQAAIRLQVCDYLLKPVNPQRLQELVLQQMKLLEEEASQTEKAWKTSGGALPDSNQIIREMLYGGDPMHPVLAGAVDEQTTYYLVLAEGVTDVDAELLANKAWASGRMDGSKRFFLTEHAQLDQTLLLQFNGQETVQNIGISGPCCGAERLHQSYLQALSALKQEIYAERPGIWRFQSSGIWQFDGEKKAMYLLNCIYAGADLAEELAALREEIRSARPVFLMYEKNIKRMLDTIIRMLEEHDGMSEACIQLKKVEEQIGDSHSLNETFRDIETALQAVSANRKEIQRMRMEQNLHRAIDYIKAHYCEDLTLEEVASQADMNPTYFSTCFKKYMGVGFIHYMMELRMHRARKLLKEEDKKICEIARMLGFGDTRYFAKIFKRYAGVTPSEYRNIAGMLYEGRK